MMRSEIANYYHESQADLTSCVGLFALHSLDASFSLANSWGEVSGIGAIYFNANRELNYSSLSGVPTGIVLIMDESDAGRSRRVDGINTIKLNPTSRSITN